MKYAIQLAVLWLSVLNSLVRVQVLGQGILPCGNYNGYGKGYILVANFDKGQKVSFGMSDGKRTKNLLPMSYKMNADGEITVEISQSDKDTLEAAFPGRLNDNTLTNLLYFGGQNIMVTQAAEPTGTLQMIPVSVSHFVNCD
ncbi:hypothetical protein FOL47_004640 [Perkinsus chesapeaki]|uniref:Uncharacterized protein n=1 Tax=Perkinsus chesapeaki TaxID=330153 RepID=A0A7J6M1D3_PERCH|nr:hypothetical protein FOL47_004640 [Perkinsus chesapeaki]